jgi:hypothetical protein
MEYVRDFNWRRAQQLINQCKAYLVLFKVASEVGKHDLVGSGSLPAYFHSSRVYLVLDV